MCYGSFESFGKKLNKFTPICVKINLYNFSLVVVKTAKSFV